MNANQVCAQKFSTSISGESFAFLTSFQKQKNLKRSQALELAIKMLQEKELAQAYKESSFDSDEQALWDGTINDGLVNETW